MGREELIAYGESNYFLYEEMQPAHRIMIHC